MQELISVIVPVFNVKNYLSKCLESILRQSYTNLEIICINDGSNDGSEIILEKYLKKDNRIIVINQENTGLSSARNTGIKNANGKYISFIDSDDYLNTDCYSLCIPYFNMGVDIICFSAKVEVESGGIKLKSDDYYYQVHQKNKVLVTPQNLIEENVSSWNKIYKSSIIKKNNLLFPVGLLYEDAEFYWKYMSYVKYAFYLKKPLYFYLRRPGSIMSQTFLGSDRAIDHLKIIDHLFVFWFKNNNFDKFIKIVGSELFQKYFWFSYRNSTFDKKDLVIKLAYEIVNKYALDKIYPTNKLIKNILQNKLYKYNEINEYSSFQKIFSIKKFKHVRILYILGIKITLKRKKNK